MPITNRNNSCPTVQDPRLSAFQTIGAAQNPQTGGSSWRKGSNIVLSDDGLVMVIMPSQSGANADIYRRARTASSFVFSMSIAVIGSLCAISQDGTWLALYASATNRVRIYKWNGSTYAVSSDTTLTPNHIQMDSSGGTILVQVTASNAGYFNNEIRVLSLTGATHTQTDVLRVAGSTYTIGHISISKDASTIACTDNNYGLSRWVWGGTAYAYTGRFNINTTAAPYYSGSTPTLNRVLLNSDGTRCVASEYYAGVTTTITAVAGDADGFYLGMSNGEVWFSKTVDGEFNYIGKPASNAVDGMVIFNGYLVVGYDVTSTTGLSIYKMLKGTTTFTACGPSGQSCTGRGLFASPTHVVVGGSGNNAFYTTDITAWTAWSQVNINSPYVPFGYINGAWFFGLGLSGGVIYSTTPGTAITSVRTGNGRRVAAFGYIGGTYYAFNYAANGINDIRSSTNLTTWTTHTASFDLGADTSYTWRVVLVDGPQPMLVSSVRTTATSPKAWHLTGGVFTSVGNSAVTPSGGAFNYSGSIYTGTYTASNDIGICRFSSAGYANGSFWNSYRNQVLTEYSNFKVTPTRASHIYALVQGTLAATIQSIGTLSTWYVSASNDWSMWLVTGVFYRSDTGLNSSGAVILYDRVNNARYYKRHSYAVAGDEAGFNPGAIHVGNSTGILEAYVGRTGAPVGGNANSGDYFRIF